MTIDAAAIFTVAGRAVAVRGDDIDTDRIIPARFLTAITFDGIEARLFADERGTRGQAAAPHPLDAASHAGARILLVNRNFGCGSSREHAPQAIRRWGIRAIVGESFAEIFFSNAVTIGLPCLTVSRQDVIRLMDLAESVPESTVIVDISQRRVSVADLALAAGLPAAARDAFVSGQWDATALLLARYEDVERTAARLPYVKGF